MQNKQRTQENSSLQRVMHIWNELLRKVIEVKYTNEFKGLPCLFLDMVEKGENMEEVSRKLGISCILVG